MIKKFFFDFLGEVALFILSLLIPFFGIFVPYKGIKRINNKKPFYIICFYFAVIMFISIMSFELTIIYIVFYMISELMYLKFVNLKNFEIYDKIFISTIFSCLLFGTIVYFNQSYFLELISLIEKTYLSMKIDSNTVNNVVETLKNKGFIITGTFIFIINFFTYFFSETNKVYKWEFSYIFIVPFIFFSLLENFYLKNDFILINAISIIKLAYSFFGITFLYGKMAYLFSNFEGEYKNFVARPNNFTKFIINFILFLIIMFFAEFLFIIGAIASFFIKENK